MADSMVGFRFVVREGFPEDFWIVRGPFETIVMIAGVMRKVPNDVLDILYGKMIDTALTEGSAKDV